MGNKMKIVILFLIHCILRTENAEAKDIFPVNSYLAQLSQNQINAIYGAQTKELAKLELNRLLSISDLWNKIKNSVTNAWNALKDIASKSKDKINVWIQNVKKRAEDAAKAFQAKLEALKDKFNNFIQAIKKIAGDVKQCIQDDKDAIKELLKQIAVRVATCVTDSVNKTSVLDSYQSKLMLDDADFIKEAEDKMNKCVQNVDDADECLNKARREIYDDMEHKETGILETRSESRDLVQDALETVMQCAAEGIIEASEAITQQVIKIINCVTSEKEKPFICNYFGQ